MSWSWKELMEWHHGGPHVLATSCLSMGDLADIFVLNTNRRDTFVPREVSGQGGGELLEVVTFQPWSPQPVDKEGVGKPDSFRNQHNLYTLAGSQHTGRSARTLPDF